MKRDKGGGSYIVIIYSCPEGGTIKMKKLLLAADGGLTHIPSGGNLGRPGG